MYLSGLNMMAPKAANIEQRTIGYGWRQTQEAKLKIVGGDLRGSNQQDLDPTTHYIVP